MKVALLGQTRWTTLLADLMSRYCPDLVESAQAVTTRRSLRLLLPGNRVDVLMRVGYRPGAPTPRGIAFDLLWAAIRRRNPAARAVMYWIGTDLMNTMADAESGRLRGQFRTAASEMTHLVAAPWFADDLRRVGIDARFVLFPVELPALPAPHPLPARFSVMTYIPAGRFSHYGGEMILNAAEQLPGVEFVVFGGDGTDAPRAPGNVRFAGWTDDLDATYAASTVVLRLVRHDALGATLREGLVHARHVIYTYPVPFTEQVGFGDTPALVGLLAGLMRANENGGLTLNMAGREYALAEFDAARHVRQLGEELRAAGS
jgi:hypothetical protein